MNLASENCRPGPASALPLIDRVHNVPYPAQNAPIGEGFRQKIEKITIPQCQGNRPGNTDCRLLRFCHTRPSGIGQLEGAAASAHDVIKFLPTEAITGE